MRILTITLVLALLMTACSFQPTLGATETTQPKQSEQVGTAETTVASLVIPDEGIPLDEAVLLEFKQFFAPRADPFNWNNQALLPLYDSPKSVDLRILFWNGVGEQSLSDEETAFLAHTGFDFNYDVTRISVDDANKILQQYFGLTWEETAGIGTDALTHDPKNNCYYLGANGPNFLEIFDIVGGAKLEDCSIRLYYTRSAPTKLYAVTMLKQGSDEAYSYRFISNLPLE